MNINILDDYNVKLIHIINDKKSVINSKINRLYVINMTKDIVKRNYIIVLMQKYKINFSFVLVEKVTDKKYNQLCNTKHISKGELGCCLSHMWCLNDIIENNYENAIIFEDDVLFHKNFVSAFLKIYDSVKLDFLLLGAHDYHFASNNYKNISANQLYYPEKNAKLYGAHANFYSLKAAKMMLKIRSSLISFFDKEYGLLFEYFKKTSYVCYPNLVVTNVSASSLNHGKDFFTENEENYYKHCFTRFDFSQYNFIYLNIINKNCIPICQEDTYETYITKCLYVYFYNFDNITKIKKRISLDFFTMDEIRNIFFPVEIERIHKLPTLPNVEVKLDITDIYNQKHKKEGDSFTFKDDLNTIFNTNKKNRLQFRLLSAKKKTLLENTIANTIANTKLNANIPVENNQSTTI